MNQEEFAQNFADQFESTNPASISMETKYKDLNEWSSLMALSIIAMCDEEYDVKIKGDDIRSADTVEDLYNIVKSRMQ